MRLVPKRLAPFAAACLALSAGLAIAADDPIKARQALMKEIGDQTKAGAAMLKGEAPFDAAKAQAIFTTYGANMPKFTALFPKGSEGGDSTDAVWNDNAGFVEAIARFNKLVADNAGNAGTEAGFKTAFAEVAQDCRACHRLYKKP